MFETGSSGGTVRKPKGGGNETDMETSGYMKKVLGRGDFVEVLRKVVGDPGGVKQEDSIVGEVET